MSGYKKAYVNGNQLSKLYSNGSVVKKAYANDNNIFQYFINGNLITGISFYNIIWVTDIPASGGTATKDNCTYTIFANMYNGTSVDVTTAATVSGSLIVPASISAERLDVGPMTLTASYSSFTTTGSVEVYQEAACSPIVMKNYLGQANNAGRSKANFYCFDSGLTEITSCDYDWTGIKSFCSRNDGFYTTPNAAIDFNKPTASGSLGTIRYFEADTPDLTYISYPFGCDSTSQVSQTITSCTITSTNKVTYIRQMFRYCTNLVNLTLGDLSRASSAEKGHFQGCTHLQNVYIEKLPDEDMPSGSTTSSWCWNQATALTETSLINILNALPTTSNSRTIGIGAVNKAKLTSAAGQTALANAQSKGWTVN